MSNIPNYTENDVLIFQPGEYLELDFKNEMEARVKTELTAGKRKFLFNMENTRLINSHGASAFLAIFKDISEQNGTLAVCCVNESMVRETFQDTGIFWLCKDHIYDTEAEALKGL